MQYLYLLSSFLWFLVVSILLVLFLEPGYLKHCTWHKNHVLIFTLLFCTSLKTALKVMVYTKEARLCMYVPSFTRGQQRCNAVTKNS